MKATNVRRVGIVLWHCTEGKNRFGIISALFLLSIGIDKDTVMQDYLKQMKHPGKERNIIMLQHLRKAGAGKSQKR